MNIDDLLREVSSDSPCGEDMTYDAAYIEFERLARGTPEQQMGDAVVEAEEPDWRAVRKQGLALLEQTKDLRVSLNLTLALLQTEGVTGLRDGERINIISSLSPPAGAYHDPMRFRERFMKVALCSSRQAGQFNLRDMLLASGELAPEDGESVPDGNLIRAAFDDTDSDDLQTTYTAVKEAVAEMHGIDDVLSAQVGASSAPNLDGFRNILEQSCARIEENLVRRGAITATSTPEATEEGEETMAAPTVRLAGEINSTQDVLTALEKICTYYERSEPSSPIPLLLQRAKRLVGKPFVDIIRDISPDAMSQVAVVGGVRLDEDN